MDLGSISRSSTSRSIDLNCLIHIQNSYYPKQKLSELKFLLNRFLDKSPKDEMDEIVLGYLRGIAGLRHITCQCI